MVHVPPIEDEDYLRKANRPSGKLEKLYCKKCRKNLSLREVDVKDNKIFCKKCKGLVLEVKD